MQKTVLERLTALEVKLEELINNHLVHLDAKVDRIQWLLVTTLISIIVGLIIILFKK